MNKVMTRSAIALLGTLVGAASFVAVRPASAGAEDEFTAGVGIAQAQLVRPNIQSGQLAAGVLGGQAAAGYRDRSGFGSSTLLAVPFLALASGSKVCGTTGADATESLPQPLIADTAKNGNTKPVTVSSDEQAPFVVQDAQAKPDAEGASSITFGDLSLPLLASIKGAKATARTGVDAKTQRRVATAASEIGDVSLLGGIVTITGLQWDLEQTQIGPDSRSDKRAVTGGFTFVSIGVALPGLPPVLLPVKQPDQLVTVVNQANTLLRKLGVEIRLPRVVHNTEFDSHEVTPLTIALGGRDWLAAPAISALLNNEQVTKLTEILVSTAFDKKDCNQLFGLMKPLGKDANVQWNKLGSAAPLLLAVLAGALGGTGEIQLNLGGVLTSLEDTYYPPLSFGGANFGFSGGNQVSGDTVSALPAAPTITKRPAPVLSASSTSTQKCQTTSPAGRPGCWIGAAPFGIAVALIFSGGLLALDERARRRRQALQTTEGAS